MYDTKTIASLIITALAAVGATYGNSISPEDQTRLAIDLTNFASDLTIIMPVIAGIFHHLHTKKLNSVVKDLSGVVAADNPNSTQAQKAS
jgi:hypothetical protein